MRGCRLLALVMLGVAMTGGAGRARMAAEPAGVRDMVEEFSFEGRARTYLLHVPPGYDGKKPVPLVVVSALLHGDGPGGGGAEPAKREGAGQSRRGRSRGRSSGRCIRAAERGRRSCCAR
jgi:poly(3-hydroxybutyrate) depolymerase